MNKLFKENLKFIGDDVKIYKGNMQIITNKYLGNRMIYTVKDFFQVMWRIGFVFAFKQLKKDLKEPKKEYFFKTPSKTNSNTFTDRKQHKNGAIII